MGPVALLDKSAVQSLSKKELESLEQYYLWNIPPILLIEILADLSKYRDDKLKSISELKMLASKFSSIDSQICASRQKMCISNLLGGGVPMTWQIPLDGGINVVNEDGEKGVFFDEPSERKALRDWQIGKVKQAEEAAASYWRHIFKNVTFDGTVKIFEELLPPSPELHSLQDLVNHIEHSLSEIGQQSAYILRFVDDFGMKSQFREAVMNRWMKMGRPLFQVFAPFAYHCFRLQAIFYRGLANRIFTPRRTNIIDLEYLYYSPFCHVFISGDDFHSALAPYSLRPDQDYIRAPALKTDLAALSSHWATLDSESRIKFRKAHGGYPPNIPNSLTHHLWSKQIQPKDELAQDTGVKLSPEEQKALIKKIMSGIPKNLPGPNRD